MEIAIRKEQYGFYIDKTALNRFSKEELSLPPYNFTFINVEDKYADCEGQDFNEDFTFNVEKYNARKDSYVLEDLRQQREVECFSIINRGALWYNTLTEEQLADLQNWYKAWLDVTETRVIPVKPSWIK